MNRFPRSPLTAHCLLKSVLPFWLLAPDSWLLELLRFLRLLRLLRFLRFVDTRSSWLTAQRKDKGQFGIADFELRISILRCEM